MAGLPAVPAKRFGLAANFSESSWIARITPIGGGSFLHANASVNANGSCHWPNHRV
jgi:hypothetical protein